MQKFILQLMLILSPIFLLGQTECCDGQKIYGNLIDNSPRKLMVYDGFMYLAAQESDGEEFFSTFSKLDSDGNVIWQTRLLFQSLIFDFVQTEDADITFLVVGRTMPINGPTGGFLNTQSFISKIDDNGTVLYTKQYEHVGRESFHKILKHPTPVDADFPYYVTGAHNPTSFPSAFDDYMVLNMDGNANVKWAQEFENEDDDEWAQSLMPLPNGNIVSSGISFQAPTGNIVEIDGGTGDLVSSITTTNQTLAFSKSMSLSNGMFLFFGYFGNNGASSFSGHVSLFDESMNFLDAIQFNQSQINRVHEAVENNLGDIILSSLSPDGIPILTQVSIANNALVIGSHKYIPEGSIAATPARIATDGNLLLYSDGRTGHSNNIGGYDIHLAQFDFDLSATCLADTIIEFEHELFEFVDVALTEPDFSAANPIFTELGEVADLDCTAACLLGDEICDNGIDDDGDGFTDCEDPDLASDCCCYESPTFDLPDSIALCMNDTLILDAGDDFDFYLWTDSGGFVDTFPVITVTESDTYIINALDSCENIIIDSVIVNFILDETLTETISSIICEGDSLVINNQVYDTTGIYEQELVAVNGCDSTLIIVLEVKSISIESLSFTICEGDSITVNEIVYDSSGIYMQFFETAEGCDSLLNVQVDEVPAVMDSTEAFICPGDTVLVNGVAYDMSGTYVQELETQDGCDSILNITIIDSPTLSLDTMIVMCYNDSIDVNGVFYDSTGVYVQTVDIGTICDFTLTIHLEELPENTQDTSLIICDSDTINFFGEIYTEAGMYEQIVETDSCDINYTIDIQVLEGSMSSSDFTIFSGDTLVINGESYTEEGVFDQILMAENGCDSIVRITINEVKSIVYYDLDDCVSWVGSENYIYNEFTPKYPDTLACATIEGSILDRINGEQNPHSCTPGVNGSPAMCVSSLDECEYDRASDKVARFRINVEPDSASVVSLNALTYYHNAPETFDWIAGPEGLNNYPTFYGVRVLRNDTEIYFEDNIPTSQSWQIDTIYFDANNDDFDLDKAYTITFEFLGYCLVGNESTVSAFDLDEINVFATCAPETPAARTVAGTVQHALVDQMIPEAAVTLAIGDSFETTYTDQDGAFAFEAVPYLPYYNLSVFKEGDDLVGVSTLDLLKIKRHVLGLEAFDVPEKIIAADINNDEALTAIDLVELRKLILGIYAEYPQNDSWKFYDADYEINSGMPWSILNTIELPNSFQDDYSPQFKGIKIGDVDASYIADLNAVDVDSRSAGKELLWRYDENKIHFIASEFKEIQGFQMQLELTDALPMALVSGAIDVQSYHYNITGQTVTISWDAEEFKNIQDDQILFSLITDQTDSNLSMRSDEMKNQIYTGETLSVQSISLREQSSTSQDHLISGLKVSPNPFETEMRLGFSSVVDGQIDINIMDLYGRNVSDLSMDVYSGQNEIVLNASDFANRGSYIISISFEDEVYYKKVIFAN